MFESIGVDDNFIHRAVGPDAVIISRFEEEIVEGDILIRKLLHQKRLQNGLRLLEQAWTSKNFIVQ